MVISNLVITHFSFDFGRNSGGFWNIDRSRGRSYFPIYWAWVSDISEI